MTAHTCTTVTPGCYRCDLGRDEVIGSLAADYFDVMLLPAQKRVGASDDAIRQMRVDHERYVASSAERIEQLFAWHGRRDAADIDFMARHGWSVRDVFASNA